MKEYLSIFLLALPCIIFAQSKKDVELAIDKINIALVKGHVQKNGDSFPTEVTGNSRLYSYVKKMYPNKNNQIHKTYLNLNHAKKQFRQGDNAKTFIERLLDEYVKYEFDPVPINKIISALTSDTIRRENESIADEEKVKPPKEIQNETIGFGLDNPIQESESEVPSSVQKPKEDLAEKKGKMRNSWIYLIIGLLFGYLIRPRIENLKILRKIDLVKTNEELPTQLVPAGVIDNTILVESSADKVTAINKINTSNAAPEKIANRNWVIAHTSEIGRSHLEANPLVPCQDNHAVKNLQNGWGIAVLCDGAGSAKLSHEGSELISEKALILFETIVKSNNWIEKNQLPNRQDWANLARKALKKLRYELEQFAKTKKIDSRDLACTIIVVVYSPIGLLTTHIGDGRAGYRNQQKIWKPIITPHKGEEANQTIFITSNPWLDENFIMSGLNVPESNVIDDFPSAFTLMSDGCESHSFEMGYFDKEKQKFIEQNNPYPKFFEPLIQTILNMQKEGLTIEAINQKWSDFVKGGTEKLKNEPDDKTLILGVMTN